MSYTWGLYWQAGHLGRGWEQPNFGSTWWRALSLLITFHVDWELIAARGELGLTPHLTLGLMCGESQSLQDCDDWGTKAQCRSSSVCWAVGHGLPQALWTAPPHCWFITIKSLNSPHTQSVCTSHELPQLQLHSLIFFWNPNFELMFLTLNFILRSSLDPFPAS